MKQVGQDLHELLRAWQPALQLTGHQSKLVTVPVTEMIVNEITLHFLGSNIDQHAVPQLSKHEIVEQLSFVPGSEGFDDFEFKNTAQTEHHIEKVAFLEAAVADHNRRFENHLRPF